MDTVVVFSPAPGPAVGGAPLENFTRADEQIDASANWTNSKGGNASGYQLVGNASTYPDAVGGDSDLPCMKWVGTPSSFNAGMRVVANIRNHDADFDYSGSVLGLRETDDNNYVRARFEIGGSNGGANLGADVRIYVYETIGGSETELTPASTGIVVGDLSGTAYPAEIKVEVDDATDTVRVYINGTEYGTGYVTSKTTGGTFSYGHTGAKSLGQARIEDITAENL